MSLQFLVTDSEACSKMHTQQHTNTERIITFAEKITF